MVLRLFPTKCSWECYSTAITWSCHPTSNRCSREQKVLPGKKQARLVIDLAKTAQADGFIEVNHSHVSGVSVITGGHGLRRFLADLAGDGEVAIPTTLNSAGCDKRKMEEMDIDYPDFLEQQFEIITAYERLGIDATLSYSHTIEGLNRNPGLHLGLNQMLLHFPIHGLT